MLQQRSYIQHSFMLVRTQTGFVENLFAQTQTACCSTMPALHGYGMVCESGEGLETETHTYTHR